MTTIAWVAAVSVVVPLHNAAEFIHATLISIVRQTQPPDEIVVVDDGSTDNSGTVVAQFAATSPVPVVVVVNETPRGVARARNRGVAAASGEWIAFCDNDDLWHPRMLELTLSLRAKRPFPPAVGADCLGFALSSDSQALAGHQRERMVNYWVQRADVAELVDLAGDVHAAPVRYVEAADFRSATVFATTQLIMRRDEFTTAGGFAAWCHRADDWVLNGTIATAGRIPVWSAPLVFYRVRAASQSHALAESYLPLLTANLALRLGGAQPDPNPAGAIYRHLTFSVARDGGSLRRALGFAMLSDGFSKLDYVRLIKAWAVGTRGQ